MSLSPAEQDRISHIFFSYTELKTQEVISAGGSLRLLHDCGDCGVYPQKETDLDAKHSGNE